MQKIMITGRVGRDAELRYTQNNKAVLSFSLATDTGYGDNKKTIWHKCAVWGDRAEKLQTHITKGTALYVEGEVTTRAWKGSDGEAKADLEVFVKELEFTGGKSESHGHGEQSGYNPAPQPDLDDDIGF